jgi:hypothetical protein
MIELVALWFLRKPIGTLAAERGRRPDDAKLLLTVSWLGCEFLAIVGTLASRSNDIGRYVAGLVGAGIGGLFAFGVAARGHVVPEADQPFDAVRYFTQAEVEDSLRSQMRSGTALPPRWHLDRDGSLIAYLGGGRRFGLGSAAAAAVAIVLHLLAAPRTAGPLLRILAVIDVVVVVVMLLYAVRWPVTVRLTADAVATRGGRKREVTLLASVRSIETSRDHINGEWCVDLRQESGVRRFAFERVSAAAAFVTAITARRPRLEPTSPPVEQSPANTRMMTPTRWARRSHVRLLIAWAIIASTMATWGLAGTRRASLGAVAYATVSADLDQANRNLPEGETSDADVGFEVRECDTLLPLMRVDPPTSFVLSLSAKQKVSTDKKTVDRWRTALAGHLQTRESGLLSRKGYGIGVPTGAQRWVEISTECVAATATERDKLVASFQTFATRLLAVPVET